MNWSDKNAYSGELDELIEPFLDGLLAPDNRQRVLDAVRSDESFAGQVALARSIREALRTMPGQMAPPDLVPSVIAEARRDAGRQAFSNVLEWVRSIGRLDFRPALATATLVAVIVSAGILGRPPAPEVTPEAYAALEQIKFAFSVVSEVSEKTAVHLREDVLEPHVVGHMQDAFQTVFEDPRGATSIN